MRDADFSIGALADEFNHLRISRSRRTNLNPASAINGHLTSNPVGDYPLSIDSCILNCLSKGRIAVYRSRSCRRCFFACRFASCFVCSRCRRCSRFARGFGLRGKRIARACARARGFCLIGGLSLLDRGGSTRCCAVIGRERCSRHHHGAHGNTQQNRDDFVCITCFHVFRIFLSFPCFR